MILNPGQIWVSIRGRLPTTAVAQSFRAARQKIALGFYRSVTLQIAVILALFEAIFLAERFPMIFRQVLTNDASLFDMTLILGLNSTQIFDLALSIAVLMAVYWTVLRMREDRELLVLSAAGNGPYHFIGLVFLVAVGAQIGSLSMSGIADPLSRYVQRSILFDAEFHALRTGISSGQFFYLPNRVAYAPPHVSFHENPRAAQTRRLFVYERLDPATSRIVTAEHAQLVGPDRSGMVALKLGGFSSRTFLDTAPADVPPQQSVTAPSTPQPAPRSSQDDQPELSMHVRDVTQQMTADELLPFPTRGTDPEELTIFEQLGGSFPADHHDAMRLLGERFARSLLCLLAPLIALFSVCLTSRRTNYLTLPLACMVLMSLNVTSAWLIRTLDPSSPLGAVALPALLIATVLVLLVVAIVQRQGELVRPQLARP